MEDVCAICGEKVFRLKNHILLYHSEITPEEYYLKYILKEETWPKCAVCGKEIKTFINNRMSKGFKKVCSKKCGLLCRNFDDNTQNTFWDDPLPNSKYTRCQLCGKPVLMLSNHLQKFHGYSSFNDLMDYYSKYIKHIDLPPKCKICGKVITKFKMGGSILQGPQDFCSMKCKNEYLSSEALKRHIDGVYRKTNAERFIQENGKDTLSFLYVAVNSNEKIFKIGVTTQLNIRKYAFNECDNIIYIESTAEVLAPIECDLLLKYKEFYTSHKDSTYNNTEWLTSTCLENVIKDLEEMCESNKPLAGLNFKKYR